MGANMFGPARISIVMLIFLPGVLATEDGCRHHLAKLQPCYDDSQTASPEDHDKHGVLGVFMNSSVCEDHGNFPIAINGPVTTGEPRNPDTIVVFQKDVYLPSESDRIALDIVHNFDMFIEFHESEELQDMLSFRMDVSNMGNNQVPYDFKFDYTVISPGLVAEVLVNLDYGDDVKSTDVVNELWMITTCTAVIVIIVLIRYKKGGALTMLKERSGNTTKRLATVQNLRRFQVGNGMQDYVNLGCSSCLFPGCSDECHNHVSDTKQNRIKKRNQNLKKGKELEQASGSRDIFTTSERPITELQQNSVFSDREKRSPILSVTPTQDNGDTVNRHDSDGRETIEEKEIQSSSSGIECTPQSLTFSQSGKDHNIMEQMSSSPSCQPEQLQVETLPNTSSFLYIKHSPYHVEENHSHAPCHITSSQPVRRSLRLRGVALVVFATLVVVAVAVGVSKLRAKPTLHVTFPASNVVRKVRMFSDFPDLTQLSKKHSSLSLVSRLQLLDTQRCKENIKNCKISVVCDTSTDQSINCRCRNGFYFKEWQCHECKNQCPPDHFLASSCSATSDAICKPCSACKPSQYEAAQCSTHRDSICIDVSFPVGILPLNKSHLSDDGIEISVSHSSNVFMERLIDMEALETPMYVTNNQQSLHFVWPRLSGLDIAVSVSGVFLVPDYRDLDAVDDTKLFHKLPEPSQHTKDYYNYVQEYFCRHPVPDYYSLQLEIIANRTSAAQLVRCDSQDESVPKCPEHYKDGDRYLDWKINKACPNFKTKKLEPLKDGPNSVVCTDETEMLRKVFSGARPTTQEYMFPSRECEGHRRQCEQCLKTAQCPAGSKHNDSASYLSDNQCCGIPCYTQTSCQTAYSPDCPQPKVECATGDVNIFSLFPHFDSMDKQFACHLRYAPPPHLYSISYTVRAPSINFNMTPQHFTVSTNSKEDHERRISKFDFISALHDTRLKVEDELILIGDHNELMRYGDSLMKPYTIRELKTPKQLSRKRMFTHNYASKSAYIQLERPFLYSSLSWYRDGCHKNVSQIYPNQTIYHEDFTPVMARKNRMKPIDISDSLDQPPFTYQLYHRDRAPYVKFYVEKAKSVLQHLQGTIVKGKLVPSSLYGRVSWHHDTSTWKLVFSGRQDVCPTVISLKIFTQLMTGCAGHFDLLINCPEDFTVTFNFTTGMSDLPDIFVVQVNDSITSHNMVLSSVYSPINVDEVTTSDSAELRRKMSVNDEKNSLVHIWAPILVIIIITLILLGIIFISYSCINKRVKRVDMTVTSNTEAETVALNNQGEKFNQKIEASAARPKPKYSLYLFVFLYIIYAFVFTFTLTFGIVYLSHAAVWANITNPEHLGKELQDQVNKSLLEIQKFEQGERLRLFQSFEERRKACIYHLRHENEKLLQDYESTTKNQVEAIFVENKTLHHYTNQIQKQNVSAYMQEIHGFVSECNKTIHAIVDRFQANYFQFLRNTALNDWLKVPRQIFLYQDGEDPDRKFLSSTQIKQFASWLEIDKTEELLMAKENVFGRLSSISIPQVSTLDVTFPSVHPHLVSKEPAFDFDVRTHTYTVLEPSLYSENSTTLTHVAKPVRGKRDVDGLEFGLSGNLKHNPDDKEFSDTDANKGKATRDDIITKSEDNKSKDASYETDHLSKGKEKESLEAKDNGIDEISYETNVVNIKEPLPSNLIRDNPSQPEALTSSSSESNESSKQDSKENNKWLYILIAIFIALDAVLLAYRLSWLSSQYYAAKHGYADRIPTDDACKQVLEIQTAYHLPSFENPHDETSGYYVDGKEQLYVTDRETTDITFLQSLPKSKESKDDILTKIWNEKMNKSEDRTTLRMRKCFLVRWWGDLRRILQRLFLSQLIWQGTVTFLAISFICLFVYCLEFWLTADNFRTLVGGQSAAADVQWHLDTSDRYLQGLAQQLSIELQRLKELCESEVDVLADMFFSTVNMQTSMFTTTLQRLCREAKGDNCDKVMAHQSTGGRIVGCNFLPVQAQTFHDLSLSHMEAVVAKEVTPLMNLSHQMLAVSTSLVILLLCCRLLCQATGVTVRHFLLLTGRLPRVRVYQCEDKGTMHGQNSTTMQRSQSWVDSCESGVYLGEIDEANKEESR